MRGLALGLILTGGMAAAQAEYSVPAEFPPDNYSALQYVDSRGCAYIRAGVEGAVNWLPRVTRERTPMCGLQPTFANSPSTVSPVVVPPAPVAASVAAASVPRSTQTVSSSANSSLRTAQAPTRLPPGYVLVWDDDRLNRRRAQGTPQGEAAMARIWTDDVPAKLVPPETLAAVPTIYVQIATFASEADRARVVDSLRQQGVPARNGVIRKGRNETLAALLGPYASQSEAQAVLSSVQALGYPSARIR